MNSLNCLTKILRSNSVTGTVAKITRLLHTQKLSSAQPSLPILAQITNNNNSWIWQKNDSIRPPIDPTCRIELPERLNWILPSFPEPVGYEKIIEAPSTKESDISKEAVRLIVIRRKKMKKHKLKKLRKKMKFENAKRRQRREMKKEKLFQAVLITQCKQAEMFSAEQYVQERIDKLNEIIIPKRWKGRRLPEFIIREKMGLPPK